MRKLTNIPQCTELPILGVTFHKNCKYSGHVRARLIKANKYLFVLRSLRKEGFSQGEVDHLFNALVLPNFTYGLPVYGAVDSDLAVIQNVLDGCFKRKNTSKKKGIRDRGGGGAYSLIWAIKVCAAPKGRVFQPFCS